jgi:hypothetical protein
VRVPQRGNPASPDASGSRSRFCAEATARAQRLRMTAPEGESVQIQRWRHDHVVCALQSSVHLRKPRTSGVFVFGGWETDGRLGSIFGQHCGSTGRRDHVRLSRELDGPFGSREGGTG